MSDDPQRIADAASEAIAACATLDALEQVRVEYLGKTGIISAQLKSLGFMEPEERKEAGVKLNILKKTVADQLDAARTKLQTAALNERLQTETIDVTTPPRPEREGSIHPLTQVMEEVIAIMGGMGFTLAEGPEVEDDFHNFTALNIPESHPARQMQDTFYFPENEKGERSVLRTHTSSVQIRAMENAKPPHKLITLGRTYRSDWDMTHTPMFHQVEGLYIDKNITMGHLKHCLERLVAQFFGVDNVPMRFRPSYFPFTEPSAEVDIGCAWKDGTLNIGAGEDWMEILGCGMVHPNVLKNVGIDPNEYQGFAFGMGLERAAMLKYGMPDLRNFFESDVRWLKHYGFASLDIPSLVGGLTR